MASFDVVAVGEINVDLILRGDVQPAFGQAEKLVDEARLCIGSSAAIFSCGAARLGLRTAIAGRAGQDVFGRFMIDSLAERGVDTRSVVTDSAVPTGVSVILSRGADRAILTHPGTLRALRLSDIDRELLRLSRHLHLSSYFLLDGLRPDVPRLFQEAKALGLTMSLDTNYDPSGKWAEGLEEALRYVDVFLPNAQEACAITGRHRTEDALRALAEKVPLVAVKLGDLGAVVGSRGASAVALPAPAVQLADTVGAGDSFNAGFLFGYLHGWEAHRSLALGIACGSLSTMRVGGTEGQPCLEDAMSFLLAGEQAGPTT